MGKRLEILKTSLASAWSKTKTFFIDHFHILFKSAAENHLRIQRCKNPSAGDYCNLEFDSYSELKRYQKRTRILTASLSSTLASVLVAIIIVQAIFPGNNSKGANYTFTQASWTGGVTSNTATHPAPPTYTDNRSGWNQYGAKDATLTAAANVQLGLQNGTVLQTADTDFNGGTNSNTQVFNTGAAASIGLQQTETANVWALKTNLPAVSVQGFAVSDGNGNIYVSQGTTAASPSTETTVFWKYNIASNIWTSLANLPVAGRQGFSVYDGNGHIFASRGFDAGNYPTVDFWKYDIASNTWTTMANMPYTSGGPSGVYDGNGNIFVRLGANTNYFYKYNIALNTWSAMAPMPVNGYNGVAAYDGNGNIFVSYGQDGGNVTHDNFYKYNIAGNSWTTMANMPATGTSGGGATYDGLGNIFVSRSYSTGANSTADVWKYNIAGNSWTSMANFPEPVNSGVYAYDKNGYIFASPGWNNTAFATTFYRYNINNRYLSSGTYTSSVIDAGRKVISGTLSFGSSVPANSSLTLDVRSGSTAVPDGTWTAWQTGIASGAAITGLPGNRYVQYRANFSNSVYYVTALLNDVTLNYQYYGGASPKMLMRFEDSTGTIANGAVLSDSSGNGYNGTVASTGTLAYASGKVGQSASFDGTNNVTNSAFYNNPLYSFTLGGWFKTTNAAVGGGTIATLGSSTSGGGGSSIGLASGNVSAKIAQNSTVLATITSTATFNDGNWHYAAVSFNNQTLTGTLYVDGNSVGTGTITTPLSTSMSVYRVGAGLGTAFGAFIGNLDEVSIYDRALSQSEITNLYNSGTALPSLTSSWYNSSDASNFFTSIAWNEDASLPTGTRIKVQVQTAPMSGTTPGTPTGFMGPDGTPGSFYTSSTAGCNKAGQTVTCSLSPSIAVGDGANDQWMQYKLLLDSDGINTPTVTQAQMNYVVNDSPVVSSVSAAQTSMQDTDGILKFKYTVSDGDQSSVSISYGADVGATLSGALDSTTQTVALSGSYSNLPSGSQTVQIDQEQMICTSRNTSSLSVCTRGANGTRSAAHSSGATVWFVATPANTTGAGNSITLASNISGTWNIKSDLSNVYAGSARLRVIANDNQLANQVSLETGATAMFVLDTTNPATPSAYIDHTKGTNGAIVVNQPFDDSTNFDVYLSTANTGGLAGLFNASNKTTLNQLSTYTNTYNYTALSGMVDPATVYVGLKDAYGNTSNVTLQTPLQPQNIKYYDISNTNVSLYREFITWDVTPSGQVGSGFQEYDVYRSTDGTNFTKIGSVNSRGLNYYTDSIRNSDGTGSDTNFNPASPTHYYYKVTTVDTNGNTSAYSSTIDDTPNGVGSTDTTPPTISNITISNVNTTSATVTWTT
ncbi:MAG TPA: LamG-like jellyroll fold domain-containing protein, partial [Patescibacteria group bacterium]